MRATISGRLPARAPCARATPPPPSPPTVIRRSVPARNRYRSLRAHRVRRKSATTAARQRRRRRLRRRERRSEYMTANMIRRSVARGPSRGRALPLGRLTYGRRRARVRPCDARNRCASASDKGLICRRRRRRRPRAVCQSKQSTPLLRTHTHTEAARSGRKVRARKRASGAQSSALFSIHSKRRDATRSAPLKWDRSKWNRSRVIVARSSDERRAPSAPQRPASGAQAAPKTHVCPPPND